MNAYLLSVVGAVVSIGLILEMLRRGRLREKYAVLWLGVGVGLLALGVRPQLLSQAADLLGVVLPSNLLFFVTGLVLLLISLQQSSEISRLEEETRTLAEEVALLRLAHDDLARDDVARDARSRRDGGGPVGHEEPGPATAPPD